MFAGLVGTLMYFLRVGSPAVTVLAARHVLQPVRRKAYIPWWPALVLPNSFEISSSPKMQLGSGMGITKRLLTHACKHNKLVSSTSSYVEFDKILCASDNTRLCT